MSFDFGGLANGLLGFGSCHFVIKKQKKKSKIHTQNLTKSIVRMM
jgi:hypothetical protein